MKHTRRPILFGLFLTSGFCGLLYQVVWTRLAFASFGIITPVLSVVISVFMLGLSLGSWLGGKWIGALTRRAGVSAAAFYGMAELLIGVGAVAVPQLFGLGERLLLTTGEAGSTQYLVLSAIVLGLSLLPWCVLMGTTFPFMMAYIREREVKTTETFSYLYLANVVGAVAGTLLSALVLIELLGFRHTLLVAGAGNLAISLTAFWLAWENRGVTARLLKQNTDAPAAEKPAEGLAAAPGRGSRASLVRWVLFGTGFCSMAMEVVWTRAFTPVLKTQVYSFALVVAAYLVATFVGSFFYRRDLRAGKAVRVDQLLGFLCAAALLPILVNDPRIVHANWLYAADPLSVVILLASICPLCGLLGYITPALIDEYAAGSPATAGSAYALNVLGCILGPLFACYGLLPFISEKSALLLLAVPLAGVFLFPPARFVLPRRWQTALGTGAVLASALFISQTYEEKVLRTEKHPFARRDYAASVLSYGEGFYKLLCVNGLGMTTLTPITKFMVHVPLALQATPPKSALVICFGMGTSFRSALSWGIDTTAVELVPSVPSAFGFFHADASRWTNDPNGKIVIDDGRRYLKRTSRRFDIIVVDPPPPVEAAGSSLLYAEEFFELAKQHLQPGGILQIWYPGGDLPSGKAMLRSLSNVFPHVRCFDSVEGYGAHLFASMQPMERVTGAQLAARMPVDARKDLLEWCPQEDAARYLDTVLQKELPVDQLLDPNVSIRIADDKPYNEYFLLRRLKLF